MRQMSTRRVMKQCHAIRKRTRLRMISLYVAAVFIITAPVTIFGRGDDAIGSPHRAQISQFERFSSLSSF